MCGIVGGINTNWLNFLDPIKHRGPDDTGYILYKNLEIGHVRLSILDTSYAGHQPMIYAKGKLSIIFNGEIYNHLELRSDLLKAGYEFKSHSDTETLIFGWDYWGTEILNRLNGIFSFAILDENDDTVYIVRDKYGVKPLYYYMKGNSFAFSSEIKAFNNLDDFDDSLDLSSFTQYLSFLWSTGDQTPYLHVKKLLPGHYIKIKLSNTNKFEYKKYFELPFNGRYLIDNDETELITELDEILRQAIKRQLLSDVPLGFYLSGGLDSSLLVAIARDLMPNRKSDCFTIGVNHTSSEGATDDLPFAKKVAKHIDVNLHVVPAESSIFEQFDHMIWHLDEPQADPAPINVYNISSHARKLGFKVLIGGTAGDDLFSGYRRHQALGYERVIQQIPISIRKALKISFSYGSVNIPMIRKIQKLTRDWDKSYNDRLLGYFNWLPNDQLVYDLFSKDHKNSIEKRSPYHYFNELLDSQNNNLSHLDKLLVLELKTFLVDHNLNYTDKMSMAAGIETRVPYLDDFVVNFAGRVPSELKLKGNQTKYILKKVAEKYLPKDVIYRPKTGFGAPIRGWIKNELKPVVEERLSVETLRKQGIFNPQSIQQIINKNDIGSIDYSYTIWSLLAIQSWLNQFKWSIK